MGRGDVPADCDPLLYSHVVLPLLTQLSNWREAADRGERRRPVMALNGPVGAGKSTLGRQLEALAPRFGLKLMVASIDDLYLGWPERGQRLAGNPFGVTRVPPGSHDLPLLMDALQTWRRGASLRLPRFDKTLAGGEGDRDGWRQQDCDALVLEGWLMGCRALPTQLLSDLIQEAEARGIEASGSVDSPVAAHWNGSPASGAPPLLPEEWRWLPRWNRELEAYQPLWRAIDGLWLLQPEHWGLPRRWRFQAEARQRRSGGGWLAPEVLGQVVRASLCSLPPALYQERLIPSAALKSAFIAAKKPVNADPAWAGTDKFLVDSTRPSAGGENPTDLTAMGSAQSGSRSMVSPGSQGGRQGSEHLVSGPPIDGPVAIRPDEGGPPVQGVAWLDGRRRCRRAWVQASASPSSSATG